MTKTSVYKKLGGLDEKLAVSYNDVDFCLRIREKGYLVVYNPFVEFWHYESKTRGYELSEEKDTDEESKESTQITEENNTNNE